MSSAVAVSNIIDKNSEADISSVNLDPIAIGVHVTKEELKLSSSNEMASTSAPSPNSSSPLRFLFCAGGIFVCYFFYGILQERM